jgi:hypothetical protein
VSEGQGVSTSPWTAEARVERGNACLPYQAITPTVGRAVRYRGEVPWRYEGYGPPSVLLRLRWPKGSGAVRVTSSRGPPNGPGHPTVVPREIGAAGACEGQARPHPPTERGGGRTACPPNGAAVGSGRALGMALPTPAFPSYVGAGWRGRGRGTKGVPRTPGAGSHSGPRTPGPLGSQRGSGGRLERDPTRATLPQPMPPHDSLRGGPPWENGREYPDRHEEALRIIGISMDGHIDN